jgi:hypothetical protein
MNFNIENLDYLNKILNCYNLNKDNKTVNYELEITYHLNKNINLYKLIFNKLKKISSDISVIENIDIFYKYNQNEFRVTKQFKHGNNLDKDIYLKKKNIMKPYSFKNGISNISKYSLKLKSEENVENTIGFDFNKNSNIYKISKIRIKLRISFLLKDIRVDLDLINNFNIKNNNIKEIKNAIFKKYNLENITEEINYSLFDEILLETEFLNNISSNNDITENILLDSIQFINKSLNDNSTNDYQKYIYNIATFIISNKLYLNNFKQKSGLKKLLNNVIELNSELYYKKIVPDINNYYLTDKIDGLRCIIYISEYMDNIDIKLVANKLYQIKEYNYNIDENNNSKPLFTILDCELIINKNDDNNENNKVLSLNDINIYIFDIITYESNDIGFKPFEKRYELLTKIKDKITNLHKNIDYKEFIRLDNNYKTQIKDFYHNKEKSNKYEIDGLIFTPANETKIYDDTNIKKINTNYNNMIGYKWKPIEHMSIDFYMVKLSNNIFNKLQKNKPFNTLNTQLKKDSNIYILFSGISKYDFDKLNLTYLPYYNQIIDYKYHNKLYFPIQFSPSDDPYNYIYIDSKTDLDNKIGEFLYDTINKKWILKKIRTDRDVELLRGEYFGNYFKISELIWNSINNPLTLDMLTSDNTSYFINDDNTFYKAQRSFNSFVKSKLIENIISKELYDYNKLDWVIDLAAGKGQDLARLVNYGFKNGLFIDNDKNALMELINRKYNLRTKTKSNMKIYTQNIDLTKSYIDIISNINTFEINKESIDIIICNFAIHYIISDNEKLINIIKLLDYYLKPGGRFIFTCFNGHKIFKLLENTNNWNSYENNNLKYSIKKLYNNTSFLNTGLQIDVLLPFSNNQYYTEYLMNLDYILKSFNDNNFISEISLSFNHFLNDFQIENPNAFNKLSESDIEYIGLYQFNVIKKNAITKNKNIIIKTNINKIFKTNIGVNLENYTDTKKEGSNNNLYGNLDQLDNIYYSNSILLIINTQNKTIIKDIINKFDRFNYKNKNIFTKNKNRIIKYITFEPKNYDLIPQYLKIYLIANGLSKFEDINKEYKNKYDSIIFYDINVNMNNDNYDLNQVLPKSPIIPIILTNDNNNNHNNHNNHNNDNNHNLILNSNDCNNLIKYFNNLNGDLNLDILYDYLSHSNFISNSNSYKINYIYNNQIVKNTKNIDISLIKELLKKDYQKKQIQKLKYFDLI